MQHRRIYVYLSFHPFVYLSICLSVCLPIYLSIYLCLSIYLPIYLPTYLPTYLSIYLSSFLSICLSVYLSIDPCVFPSACLSFEVLFYSFISRPICFSIFLFFVSLVLRLPREMHLCRASSNVPRLPSFLDMLQNPHVVLTVDKVHSPLRLPRKTTSERPKVVRACLFFNIFISKYASRHNGAHFFDISTAKSFWNWSVVHILTSKNVLRATTACTFSTSQLLKVFRSWGVLYILTSKCASCHNSVQFSSLIWPAGSAPAALASLLYDPPEPQIIGKTNVSRLFQPASSFFWLFLFSDLLSSSLLFSSFSSLLWFFLPLLFYLSILSEVWLLNLLRSIWQIPIDETMSTKLPVPAGMSPRYQTKNHNICLWNPCELIFNDLLQIVFTPTFRDKLKSNMVIGTPWTKWKFIAGKIIERNGGFASKPCDCWKIWKASPSIPPLLFHDSPNETT